MKNVQKKINITMALSTLFFVFFDACAFLNPKLSSEVQQARAGLMRRTVMSMLSKKLELILAQYRVSEPYSRE